MSQCVLMQHGVALHINKNVGICCYNSKHPSTSNSYDIDPEGCKSCVDQEHNGIKSYRQGANQKYGLVHVHRSPIVLDIAPNFNCNLTCKICGEDSSSSWAKLKQIKIKKNHNVSPGSLNTLLSDFDLAHVREINFSGGEPLLNDNIYRYITLLSDRIDFSNCELRFSTNGTQPITEKLQNFFLQFKLVMIRFSIDDIEQGFEYQRHPAVWSHTLDNWHQWLAHVPHNVLVSVNRTVSVLNVHRLSLLEQWLQQYPSTKYGDPIELLDHFAFGNFALSQMTPALKKLALATGNQRACNYVINRAPTSNSQHLQSVIENYDKLQGTSMQQWDPDLYAAIFQ